jgi:DNA invertase Pin-like site-specific DNA recombinase
MTSVAVNDRLASPPQKRRRLTARLRAEVVEAYQSGQTSRQVAERFSIGKATVLKILKEAGATVRPQGRKY